VSYRNETVFLVLYLLCGISDFIDGYIARKTNTETVLGAKLDSIADMMMFAAVLSFIFLRFGKDSFVFIPFFIVIAVVRGLNLVFAGVKYHSFVLLHTYGNKITGILVFIVPLYFLLFHSTGFVWVVLWIAFFSSVEEGVIHFVSKNVDRDRKSIFSPVKSIADKRKTC
jgi:CDP-diacylglycerol--glycerol-3-phosphate 3-phosphatidyltransferase